MLPAAFCFITDLMNHQLPLRFAGQCLTNQAARLERAPICKIQR